MTYSITVASFLSGATVDQLQRWARTGIVVPEVNPSRPKIYSFRDVVALRSIAKLRASHSLQRIRNAINKLNEFDFTEHLSQYRFATDGKSIKIWDEDEDAFLDLVNNPGQWELINLEDIYAPFMNLQGRQVPDLLTPAKGIQINPHRLSGAPTLEDTRVPFDLIVDLLDDDLNAQEISELYPTIEADSVDNAIRFDQSIKELAA